MTHRRRSRLDHARFIIGNSLKKQSDIRPRSLNTSHPLPSGRRFDPKRELFLKQENRSHPSPLIQIDLFELMNSEIN